MQLVFVAIVIVLWVLGILLASFDGTLLLKVITPMVTLVIGWLFAARVGADAK